MGDSSTSRSIPADATAEIDASRQRLTDAHRRLVALNTSMTTDDRDAAEEAFQVILHELDWIGVEASRLARQREEESLAREQIARLSAELERIHQSAGWVLVQRVQRMRRRLFREGTARAWLWKLGTKTVKRMLHGRVRTHHKPIGRAMESGRRRAPTIASAYREASRPAHRLKVTAIVPNYNHEAYLEERLQSIFDQTRLPDEILFLDDASGDESLEVARRMASQSPVPFRMVLNERNSGSTFRQWIKGFDLATGDLIWIAESDDSCAPEFLETMIPAFDDHEVSLAYCQSAVIGPNGELYADNYLFNTDDISFTHWRSAYCTSGAEDVELALSQKNTIPNASAVVFRKPESLDYADELVKLRLTGDWLFYAMQVRTAKIAFVPQSLNFHRQHPRTVRNAFEHAARLFDEQLRVKARIFESFPVSTNAISRSLGCTFRDDHDRANYLGIDAAPVSQNAELAPHLTRIARVSRASMAAPDRLRVLMVVDALDGEARQLAAIRLASALANREQVFLVNARPWTVCPRMAAQVDERVVLLEGTLGITPWSFGGNSDQVSTPFDAVSTRRARVLEELIRFHDIDVIHSHGWWADRLVATVNRKLGVPWFIDLRGEVPGFRAETDRDPDFERLIGPMLSSARGVFYSDPDELSIFARYSIDHPSCETQVFDSVHAIARDCHPEKWLHHDQAEFRVLLACTDRTRRDDDERAIVKAVQQLNALDVEETGHRRIRLIIPNRLYGSRPNRSFAADSDTLVREVDAEVHEIAFHCDVALITGAVRSRDATACLIECLASGLPIVADPRAVPPDMLVCDEFASGISVPSNASGEPCIDRLLIALRDYLQNPEHLGSHRQGADVVYDRRFHLDLTADRVLSAYRFGRGRTQRSAIRSNQLRIA